MPYLHTLNDHDFALLAKSAKDRKTYQRLMILAHTKAGFLRKDVARSLNISTPTVRKWLNIYLESGLQALVDKPRSGRPRYLSNDQIQLVKNHIQKSHFSKNGGRLQGSDILQYIVEQFGVKYSLNGIYVLLHNSGMSWVSSRSKHPMKDQKAQDEFKKNF